MSGPIGFELHAQPSNNSSIGFEGVTSVPSSEPLYPRLDGPGSNATPAEVDMTSLSDVNPTASEAAKHPVDSKFRNAAYDSTGDSINSSAGPGFGASHKETEGVALLGVKKRSDMATVELDTGVNSEESQKQTMYFRDNKRRIDYVLAYQEDDGKQESARKEKRREFEKNLRQEGLDLEYEDKAQSQDGKTTFVKIHAPWKVLTIYAELMKIKMPMKINDVDEDEDQCCHGCKATCASCFDLSEEYIQDEPDYFTAIFSRHRLDQFLIPEDRDTFFTNAQRSRMVFEILSRARYEESREKFGIKRLLNNGTYTAAFPLHEGDYTSIHSILTRGPANDRHLLYESWAKPARWYKYQPLDLIRKYFGEKIAIYFNWLGFYTSMLIPASIVGVIVFFYGVGTMFSDQTVLEICDPNNKFYAGNMQMCPQCDERCGYWKLKTSCLYSRFTYIFDNYATCGFAIFMSLWATFFIEFWKRRQAEFQYDWDVADYEEEEQNIRPEFEAAVRHKKKNPVTQEYEPFLPLFSKIPRWASSFVVILFMIVLVLAAIFGVILYRIVVVVLLYSTKVEVVMKTAGIVKSITAAIISLVIITILNKVYEKVAYYLTNWESHRTETEWEDSFTFKMFLFQAVNYYGTIFYIAFFKGRIQGRPGDYARIAGFRQEECDPAGCLIDLCIQLGIVMLGKQCINNFKELFIPWILKCLRTRKSKKTEKENVYTRWEQDFDLSLQPNNGLFEEYLEMVIQFGFVTIFVAAFPLAPLCALINNFIEIRLDAYKFVCVWRRPMAARAQDIGVWFYIIKTIARIATLTNGFILAFTSDFVPKLVYKYFYSDNETTEGYVAWSLSSFNTSDFEARSVPQGVWNVTECKYRDFRESQDEGYTWSLAYWHVLAARLAFIVVFEHFILFLTWIVAYLVPDMPADVKVLELRENFLAKNALYDAEVVKANRAKSSHSDNSDTV